MKKGRPGTVVHVLCDPSMAPSLRAVLRESTGSLGVRATAAERWPAARSFDSVWIDGQLIRVKVSAGRVKAEHDDVALAARRTGQSLRDLAQRAEALWRSGRDGPRAAATGVAETELADDADDADDANVADDADGADVTDVAGRQTRGPAGWFSPQPPAQDGDDDTDEFQPDRSGAGSPTALSGAPTASRPRCVSTDVRGGS